MGIDPDEYGWDLHDRDSRRWKHHARLEDGCEGNGVEAGI